MRVNGSKSLGNTENYGVTVPPWNTPNPPKGELPAEITPGLCCSWGEWKGSWQNLPAEVRQELGSSCEEPPQPQDCGFNPAAGSQSLGNTRIFQ